MLEELYRTAPLNCIEQKDWWQWENQYLGKPVKDKGLFYSVQINPGKGKLFFVVALIDEKGPIEDNTTKVVILIDDAHHLSLGEKEGSFLIDRVKWICLGEFHSFEGKVHVFGRFDPELCNTEFRNLAIVRTKLVDVVHE
jgi:hypothetical protein